MTNPATGLTKSDVEALACPSCHGAVVFEGNWKGDVIDRGILACATCERNWPVREGLANLIDEAKVRGSDRWLRRIYGLISPTHDLGVRFVLPVIQFPDPDASRLRYIERLELDALRAREDGTPLRVLEVGVGAGANLPLLETYLPMHLDVEVWGIDLSARMLSQCRRRFREWEGRRVRLLLADAHALPFPDATFDRVFHVGGVNGYGAPDVALAEMGRVARPRTPIVVVDEGLDPDRLHTPLHWLAFRMLTAWDREPRAPMEHLPATATQVELTAVSRFYYCLRFRMP